jgi:tryptophan synthase alpha chain
MNRISRAFADGNKKLIAYLTAGDPSPEETPGLVIAAARAGADIIELGVPWSDPSADGPVIQLAMQRALAAGGSLRKTLEIIREIRKHSEVPIVLFGYYNPIFQYGIDRFGRDAAVAGADGILIVDLPYQEWSELELPPDLYRVPLLTPTTPVAHAETSCRMGGGFAYYVALTGVTGAGHLDTAQVLLRVAELRPWLNGMPLAVGFGIKDAAGARAVAAAADAVVVGSALVAAVAAAADAAARKNAVEALIGSLKSAIGERPPA